MVTPVGYTSEYCENIAARRAQVEDWEWRYDIEGTTERPGEQPLRQANQFFYLSTLSFRPELLGCASSSDPATLWRNNKADAWDGRSPREEAFILHIKKEVAPQKAKIENLDPILDELRGTKSAREIAVIREATVNRACMSRSCRPTLNPCSRSSALMARLTSR
jgi:Xaa-Pro aminopeptidase